MTTKSLPMGNGGIPWGIIIIAVIILGGVSYVGYQRMKAPEPIKETNS